MRQRAPRNRTLTIEPDEQQVLISKTDHLTSFLSAPPLDTVFYQDVFTCAKHLPKSFVDLLIVDPPYNLNKNYGSLSFKKQSTDSYRAFTEDWVKLVLPCLKPSASVYVCCDWQSSPVIYSVLSDYFKVRNRITWEREKGRGAKTNWKNCSEDIWFCTVTEEYFFDVEAVKLKKRVIAPYRDENGKEKDWKKTDSGNFRLTHPSNLWTDISIPFWSMPENTDHPTQKPEKLLAKLILASSKEGDVVFDPFLGSGTTAVAAKKLKRRYVGIEIEEEYCQMAVKRLQNAEFDLSIQGYHDGCFWERNTLSEQKKAAPNQKSQLELIDA